MTSLTKPESTNNVEGPAANGAASIAVVDDDQGVRKAFTFLLRTAGFRAFGYDSAREFLVAKDVINFDCTVADLYLPRMNGLQLQEELRRAVPYASIVFVTGHGDLSLGMCAMRNGAVDFLEKPIDDETLLSTVCRGVNLSRVRRSEHTERAQIEKRYSCLTPREREVFVLITQGLLNKQVGAELGATERTIKAHRAKVVDKMCAESLADLVRMAGILQIHRTQAA
jgi:two-component system, LuxR family, response regulator FixJ